MLKKVGSVVNFWCAFMPGKTMLRTHISANIFPQDVLYTDIQCTTIE